MQIMFTCLMPLWSVGGRQSQRGTVLSQARSDPLFLNSGLHQAFWAAQSAAESGKQWAYVQALPWQILNPSVGER